MSITPPELPKRTRILIKDVLFQEKYRLSHTQLDIMAYIVNALTWATKVDSFLAITNIKFQQDLPQISEKTLEESLRVLKAMGLIEVEMINVAKWKNARVRGISILPKGLEYNSIYFKAKEKDVINNLTAQMSAQEQEIIELKEKLKQLESTEEEEKEKKEEELLEEAKEQEDTSTNYDDLEFTTLIKTVTKEFSLTSAPICNRVPSWDKETIFYINSYNKLTVLTPTGNTIQIKEPTAVHDFWKYIDRNRHQIGKVIDFSKELTVDELNYRYAKMEIKLQEHKFRVYKIEKLEDGVKISLSKSDSDKISFISKDGEAIMFGLEECEKVLLGLRC